MDASCESRKVVFDDIWYLPSPVLVRALPEKRHEEKATATSTTDGQTVMPTERRPARLPNNARMMGSKGMLRYLYFTWWAIVFDT